jgi:predicted XRE-type DNA-binding protein
MKNPHKGSSFDSFLEDEGLLDKTEAIAIKRVVTYELKKLMEDEHLTKTKLASKLHTSRSALERLLDPENTSVTLHSLVRTAAALGKKLNISLA